MSLFNAPSPAPAWEMFKLHETGLISKEKLTNLVVIKVFGFFDKTFNSKKNKDLKNKKVLKIPEERLQLIKHASRIWFMIQNKSKDCKRNFIWKKK